MDDMSISERLYQVGYKLAIADASPDQQVRWLIDRIGQRLERFNVEKQARDAFAQGIADAEAGREPRW